MNVKFNPLGTLKSLDPRSLKYLSGQILELLESRLWAKIILGMILGVIFGIFVSRFGPPLVSEDFINSFMAWLVLPAKFFLKLIQLVIIPLIFASVIRGLASTEDIQQMKSLGIKFSIFVLINTALASLLGILLADIFQPGKGLGLTGAVMSNGSPKGGPIFSLGPDNLLNILPVNPLASVLEGQMLDVVILAILMGVALLSIPKSQADKALNGLEVVQQVCMTIISWAMKLAPYAVFGMMAQVTASTGLSALQSMLYYIGTCFLGFVIYIIIYCFLVLFIKKESPFSFLKKIATPLLLAFSTSSSAATMPVSMKTAEEELQADETTSRFLIPLGATVNMAGSAIWHTTAIVFIGQAYNIQLSMGQLSIVIATSLASSIGSPGVPGVGIGVLTSVLIKIGVPVEGVSLILGVDRLIDMGCTTVNVAGDLTAVKIFSKK